MHCLLPEPQMGVFSESAARKEAEMKLVELTKQRRETNLVLSGEHVTKRTKELSNRKS